MHLDAANNHWRARPRTRAANQVAWIEAGQGGPVVLMHGVGLCADSFGAQIDAIAANHAVYAPDLPGHGYSAALAPGATLTDFTDCIAEVVWQVGPAVFVGHSMGAMIVLDLAVRYPALCRGVAALNAIYRRAPAAAAAVQERAQSLPVDVAVDPMPTLRRWFGEHHSVAARACRRWLLDVNPVAYKAAYDVFARSDAPADDALRRIVVPALFLTGEDEPNSTPAMSRAMAAHTARGRAEIVDGARHMMQMTHAGGVNAVLLPFIDECQEAKP